MCDRLFDLLRIDVTGSFSCRTVCVSLNDLIFGIFYAFALYCGREICLFPHCCVYCDHAASCSAVSRLTICLVRDYVMSKPTVSSDKQCNQRYERRRCRRKTKNVLALTCWLMFCLSSSVHRRCHLRFVNLKLRVWRD